MNIDQYTALREVKELDASVCVSELKDLRERTLMFGYNVERETVHVYLRAGEIQFYSKERRVHYSSMLWADAQALIPGKRAYPALCDFEFCSLLKSKGFHISFTTFEAPNAEEVPFVSDIYM